MVKLKVTRTAAIRSSTDSSALNTPTVSPSVASCQITKPRQVREITINRPRPNPSRDLSKSPNLSINPSFYP